MQYIRAFFLALRMTLRGEKPEKTAYMRLLEWLEAGPKQVQNVFTAADQEGLDENARKRITVTVDGRTQSMQTILATVAYHTKQEYPHLLQNVDSHAITAIYATNMNDQYSVRRLAQLDRLQGTHVQPALEALAQHLEQIPPSNELAE